jgi:hypothetical protein
MTTFLDKGFEVEDMYLSIIVDQIRTIYRQIHSVESPDAAVNSIADTVTDRAPTEREIGGETVRTVQFNEAELEAMKRTPVSAISFGESVDSFFDLVADGKSILKVSDRIPSRDEFRAQNVRDAILSAQTKSPSKTLYEVIQENVNDVAKNPLFVYASTPSISGYLTECGFDPKSNVFQLLSSQIKQGMGTFGKAVYDDLSTLNELSPPDSDLTDEALAFLQEKLRAAFNQHPISPELSNFLSAYHHFQQQLDIIEAKRDTYPETSDAYKAADQLLKSLVENRDNLTSGDISINQFKANCQQACQTAESSELKNHRGWKQTFANIGSAILSVATLGIANVISKLATGSWDFAKVNTDAVNKIHDMKEKLQAIKSQGIESDEPEVTATDELEEDGPASSINPSSI